MFTKVARFLLLQSVVSQDITRDRFRFVPDMGDYHTTFTDEILIKKWGLTDEEWSLIQSRIGEQGGDE
jgi:site-specific DNA-methyltransferase (adenine-specific)